MTDQTGSPRTGVFDHLRLHSPCPPESHCEWDAALEAAEKEITPGDEAGDLWHEREGWNATGRLSIHGCSFVPNTANDWRCKCGWFGNHGWQGYALHLEDALAIESEAQSLSGERAHRPIKRIRARMTEERCMVDDEFWPCRAAQSLSGEREGIEQRARLQDAYDALRAAVLWLHGEHRDRPRSEFDAQSWYRKARSGNVGLRDYLASLPTEGADR